MRQTRLETYFTVLRPRRRPRPGLTFLHLPPNVRRQVYEYLGLTGQTIDLNFSNLVAYPRNAYPDTAFAVRFRCRHEAEAGTLRRLNAGDALFGEDEIWVLDREDDTPDMQDRCRKCSAGYSLLFVCKEISREVQELVYGSNTFTVRQGCPNRLKRLKQMNGKALAALKCLTLKLDTDYEYSWCDDANTIDKRLPQPLDINSKAGRAVLQDFRQAIERLVQFVPPNQLSLFLIFRFADQDGLNAVLAPLSQLPVLRDCGIWTFGGFKDLKMVSIAANFCSLFFGQGLIYLNAACGDTLTG